ncbi:MAG: acyl-CoA dehydrogenase C-terminal domain-containing protein [Alphaproteobacteria bacterium]
MPTYQAPVHETEFLLNDVLTMGNYGNLAGFSDASPDMVTAILAEAGKLAAEVLQPLNQSGDAQGCTFTNGAVTTPDGFPAAFSALAKGGWLGLTADPDYGGQGLPDVLGAAFNEYVSSANMAFGMYPGLTNGAYSALHRHASDDLKQLYLPKLVSGQWAGTMNLTEPQCGTDLGLLRTVAKANGSGAYAITGTKIFISAGEHDLAENIIHLVLARIEGAPEGTKGISLFVVPKILVNPEGSLGETNGVSCGGIEEKMGIHANSTCVMNYDGATGWLVGEENKGLRAMFTMMNEARLGVAIQGLSQSEAAYQSAAAYAKERLQGRALTGAKAPDQPADPIIVHADVRRMLMDIRVFNEAARGLIAEAALQASVAERSGDDAQVQGANDHLDLLTPVLKGVLTDTGFANAVKAQQVFGGHGYIAEHGMEQFVRDARITMLYEGTSGIQALDLVGRKLARNGGRALMSFMGKIDAALERHKDTQALTPLTTALKAARDDLETATLWFMKNAMAKPDNAGAGSHDYMHLFGLVALGYMWVRMAATALEKLDEGAGDKKFLNAKLICARYFMARRLPQTATHLARIQAGADPVMALADEDF